MNFIINFTAGFAFMVGLTEMKSEWPVWLAWLLWIPFYIASNIIWQWMLGI